MIMTVMPHASSTLAAEWVSIPVGVLFVLIGAASLVLIVFGLPGIWVMLATAVAIELADSLYLPDGATQTFSWWLLAVVFGLAVLGEILEFAAGVIGVKKGGGTKRGMWGALIGGILGAIILTPIIPVPVIGSLIGALAGTFIGALIGESTAVEGTVRGSIKPATGATLARVLSTMVKMGIAVIIWLSLSVSAFV